MSGEKFNKYFELIQQEAAKQDKRFFMDTGEGREHITDEMEMEDISGWLVPVELKEEFADYWMLEGNPHNNLPDKWDIPFYRFALWSIDDMGKVQVEFKDFGFWDVN